MKRFKTNQLNLNILLTYCANHTDWLTTSYWQTGWLNTSDWLELQLHYKYIVIEIIKDRKKRTTWLTIITAASDWTNHLSDILTTSSRLRSSTTPNWLIDYIRMNYCIWLSNKVLLTPPNWVATHPSHQQIIWK